MATSSIIARKACRGAGCDRNRCLLAAEATGDWLLVVDGRPLFAVCRSACTHRLCPAYPTFLSQACSFPVGALTSHNTPQQFLQWGSRAARQPSDNCQILARVSIRRLQGLCSPTVDPHTCLRKPRTQAPCLSIGQFRAHSKPMPVFKRVYGLSDHKGQISGYPLKLLSDGLRCS